MLENTIHTKKKYHNPKRNKKQFIIKGGGDPKKALDLAKAEATETLNNEDQIIKFLTDKENTNQAIEAKIKNPKTTNPDTVNILMNSFKISGSGFLLQKENYTNTELNKYIKSLLQNPQNPQNSLSLVRSPFILVEDADRKIPSIIIKKKEYEQILSDASKLLRKQEIITKSLEFYDGDSVKSILEKQNKALELEKQQMKDKYENLKLERSDNIDDDIRHLKEFYCHTNIFKNTPIIPKIKLGKK